MDSFISEAGRNTSDLIIVSMALAGFSGEHNTLWTEQCKHPQLKHPYLKAMFAFLTLDTESYGEILVHNHFMFKIIYKVPFIMK